MTTEQNVMKELFEEKLNAGTIRIALVGMGYIGTCIGAVVAGRGYNVAGIDVRKKVADEINSGHTSIAEPGIAELIKKAVSSGKLTAGTDFAAVADADVVIITVGTPLGNNFDPDNSHLIAAANAIKQHLREGQLIMLKSTVPPFTTEKIVKPILDEKGIRYYLSFCPERLAEGKAIHEFESIPIVVGGVDAESTNLSEVFWKKVLGAQVIKVENAQAAELVKLADNLWIDLNIAVANEIAKLSDSIGVDVLEVIGAANSLPKGQHHVNILYPGVGVGGYCLTKDPWFVHHMGKGFGLDLKTPPASRTVNESMPAYSVAQIDAALDTAGKTLSKGKVAVLGLSFKGNTGDCRYSPTKYVIEELAARGAELALYDPWVSDEEALLVTKQALTRDLKATLAGAEAVAILTSHDEFRNIPISEWRDMLKPGAVIFDGRNMMSRSLINELQNAGFIYKGVGR